MKFKPRKILSRYRRTVTLSEYIQKKCAVMNMVIALAFSFFCSMLIDIPFMMMLKCAFVPLGIWFFFGIFIDMFIHPIITMDVSNSLMYWETTEGTCEDSFELLKKMLCYPFRKTMEMLHLNFISSALLSLFLKNYLHLNWHATLLYMCVLDVFLFILSMFLGYHIEVYINKFTVKINEKMGSVISEEKYFGLSVKKTFFFFIVIPVLSTALCTFFMLMYSYSQVPVHANGLNAIAGECKFENLGFVVKSLPETSKSIRRMVMLVSMNTFMTVAMFALFFRRINRYTRLMESSISNFKNVRGTDTALFPVDSATENSYTMSLINRTVMLFDSIMRKNTKNSDEINRSAKELALISRETQENVERQTANVEEILATMQNISTLSKSVETKIDEVTSVAYKTVDTADSITSGLNQNITKMQEITESTKVTIENLRNLSGKISSIQEIINIIDKVAEQTKTIAFSAELEANNLEDSGIDFNDISMEIRSLTNSTIDLTRKVREQIKEITNASDELIVTGNRCMYETNEGNKLCKQLDKKFNEIRKTSTHTAINSRDIKDSIHMQGEAFRQIVDTLSVITESVHNFGDGATSISQTIKKLQQTSSKIISLNNIYMAPLEKSQVQPLQEENEE